MPRWPALIFTLTFGLILPAAAQQISDQEARKIAETVLAAFNKANVSHDPAAFAALFTKDGIRVSPYGTTRQDEIERNSTKIYDSYSPEPSKLIEVKVIGDSAIVWSNTWSGVDKSPSGEMKLNGYATDLLVRDGGGWKIKIDTWNFAAGSDPTPRK